MVVVRPTCLCLLSPMLFCTPFVHGKMSAATVRLYGPAAIAELSATLVRLNGASNLLDPCVGHLLAQWSVSSPHCKARWGEATIKGGHKVVRAAEEAAVHVYAKDLITPIRAVELVVSLKAPKSSFRVLLEFFTQPGLQYSLKAGRPFPRPICTREVCRDNSLILYLAPT